MCTSICWVPSNVRYVTVCYVSSNIHTFNICIPVTIMTLWLVSTAPTASPGSRGAMMVSDCQATCGVGKAWEEDSG